MTVQEAWDPDEFLAGGKKAVPAKWGGRPGFGGVPGFIEQGVITEKPVVVQQRKHNPGKSDHGLPLWWLQGGGTEALEAEVATARKLNPCKQLIVRIQTEQRDPAIQDDDGIRAIFVKGQMRTVIIEAVKAAGATTLEVGGLLAVRFVEQVLLSSGFKQNVYEARYKAPASKAVDDFMSTPEPTQAPVQQFQAAPLGVEQNHQGNLQSTNPPDWAMPPSAEQMSAPLARDVNDQRSVLDRLVAQQATGVANLRANQAPAQTPERQEFGF